MIASRESPPGDDAADALQGAAIISLAARSILTVTVAEGQERNRALGLWGAFGVILGGILTQGPG